MKSVPTGSLRLALAVLAFGTAALTLGQRVATASVQPTCPGLGCNPGDPSVNCATYPLPGGYVVTCYTRDPRKKGE